MSEGAPTVEQQKLDLAVILNKFASYDVFQTDPPVRAPFSERTAHFQQLMDVMVPQFLSQFPLHGSWDKELTEFSDSLLDLFHRGVRRLQGLFRNDKGYERSWISHLLIFASHMNSWARKEVHVEEGICTPGELGDRAVDIVVSILYDLGSEASAETAMEKALPPWNTFVTILRELLASQKELAHTASKSFPFELSLLHRPADENHDPFNQDPDPLSKFRLSIGSSQEAMDIAAVILNVISRVLVLPIRSNAFISDLRKANVELVCDFNLSLMEYPSPNLRSVVRGDICAQITMRRSVQSLIALIEGDLFGLPPVVYPVVCRLIWLRVTNGSNMNLSIIDETLIRGLTLVPSDAVLATYGSQFAEILRDEDWGEDGQSVRDLLVLYLEKIVAILPSSTFQAIKEILESEKNIETPVIKQARSSFAQHQHVLERRSNKAEGPDILGKRKRPELDSWREAIAEELQTSLIGKLEFLKDKQRGEKEWLAASFEAVQDKFDRPLEDVSNEARIKMASSLSKIADLIATGQKSSIESAPQEPIPLMLPTFFMASVRLLDGNSSQVDISVRRSIFHALSLAVRFGDIHDPNVSRARICELAKTGMQDLERSVRMNSGKVFVAYLEVDSNGSSSIDLAEPLFDILMDLTQSRVQAVRETAISTIGTIGRFANEAMLGRVIRCLVAQWGQNNSLLKSLAFIQLKDLAKRRDKNAYSLISPYLPQIITYVSANVCTTPSILEELGRFLSRDPTELLGFTLNHSLPSLVATCSRDEIYAIAKLVGRPVAALLVDKSTDILKHVFMLPDDGDTDEALSFLTQMVAEAAGAKAGSVGTQALVNSCIANLLAELVMMLGDENSRTVLLAKKALTRVERTVAVTSHQRSKAVPKRDVATFIKPHILGIMTHLNEVLQEVQGKRSPAYKCQVIRSIGVLINQVGSLIVSIAPQVMAAMQSVLPVDTYTEVTLRTWHIFITTLNFRDIGPYLGSTSAAFVKEWSRFDATCKSIACAMLDYLIMDNSDQIIHFIDNVVSLSGIPGLDKYHNRLETLRQRKLAGSGLDEILVRCKSENVSVATLSLVELKQFMTSHEELMRKYSSGDVFDNTISTIVDVLFGAAARDGEIFEDLRLAAYECIGLLGALDPDRFEVVPEASPMIVLHNFVDEGEAITFALHLIRELLVNAFRSTSDLRYQSHLAYAIQELLKVCRFTPDLIKSGNNASIPLKIRGRWSSLPTHMLDTITPLLEGKFSHDLTHEPQIQHPIYRSTSSYREWIQLWASHLISRVCGQQARTIFSSFRLAVRSQDVEVARYLIPHLVLNILISGEDEDRTNIRHEIMVVLQDQVNVEQGELDDRRLLSAQTVFLLMDHLSTWIRMVRQHMAKKRSEAKKSRGPSINSIDVLEEQLMQVDSIITSIDQDLMATAAFNCRSYARALMTLEQLIASRQSMNSKEDELQPYYERLHHIYAHLDEPDGMEGISTKVVAPSLEHQIREHESTGRWTSAQSCWELKLQHSPDDVDLHIGLLRCLRNLGHYDTLRTHIKGILTGHPDWEPKLAGFHVEGAWMVGDWTAVSEIVDRSNAVTPETAIAGLLLSLRERTSDNLPSAFRAARNILGAPIASVGKQSYRRLYDSAVNLHLVHELEMIHTATVALSAQNMGSQLIGNALSRLKTSLAARLESTLPTFKAREPILSMRRTAFGLSSVSQGNLKAEIGRAWLASSKIARKAGHSQTAYSAMLQARQWETPFSFVQNCKLIRADGEALRALQELDNALKWINSSDENIVDLTGDDLVGEDRENRMMKAKAILLQARWMNEADRFDANEIVKKFTEPSSLVENWESPYFYFGHYHDKWLAQIPEQDTRIRGARSRYQICKQYARALQHGSKYIYQTMPRLLTIWLDSAEDADLVELEKKRQNGEGDLQLLQNAQLRMNAVVEHAITSLPVYQWLTAFPQIVSRVGHPHITVLKTLSKLIATVLHAYPHQALWLFTSVVNSRRADRQSRGEAIISQVKSIPDENRKTISDLVNQWSAMSAELLILCDHEIPGQTDTLNMPKHFAQLYTLCPSSLILPLQDSMTVTLPATSTLKDTHRPFPLNAPTFHQFQEEIQIMPSLQKPRRITIRGNDAALYSFLCKPKDDLRKDARLMDFNAMINKMLKTKSDSRRRQLRIRTYGVIPLNEECGLIEWVNNTVGMRHILIKAYEARNIQAFTRNMQDILDKGRKTSDAAAAQAFTQQILPLYPPVFHEWFLATFPEPTAWLKSRLTYSRTSAVIDMVGYVLGLGDRHGENILFDSNTGDTVHVDFNCLFDKGKTFEIPERVPFRLTQNLVDGLGVTGVEGVFRNACEITMQILRDNKDSLMSVLEAFVHDPLVEWEDEKRRKEREVRTGRQRSTKRGNPVQEVRIPQLKELAQKSLLPIERKLMGLQSSKVEKGDREITTANQVERLIKEATNPANLGTMYIGWAAWM